MRLHALALAALFAVGCAADTTDTREQQHGTFRLLGQDVELDYEAIDGKFVFAEDIVLKPESQIFPGRITQPLYKYGTGATSYLWPKGIVPYTIASNVTTPTRVRDAMKEWEAKTAIRFVARTTQAAYVTFTEEAGNGVCRANLGYDGTRQYVYLRDTKISTACSVGVLVHEIGHTLGFYHEHQRSDRDSYVKINWACVSSSAAFSIMTNGVKVGAYDILSSMHYRSTSLTPKSGCGGYAIYKKDGSLLLHDWATLSAGDIANTARLYGAPVTDADGDGVLDTVDNCPTVANKSQLDTDKDKKGDACDTDDDNDGVLDAKDNCPTVANATQVDTDGDGKGDACETDDDADGVPDATDNCPRIANVDQEDLDADGKGDLCDDDDDGDGVVDTTDNCPDVINADQADKNGNGIGDICDPDDDAQPEETEPDPEPTPEPVASADPAPVSEESGGCSTTTSRAGSMDVFALIALAAWLRASPSKASRARSASRRART